MAPTPAFNHPQHSKPRPGTSASPQASVLTDLPTPYDARARSIFWLQFASLAFAGWVIWRTAFFPFGAQYFLPEALALALGFSLCALALSGVITFLLLLSIRRVERNEMLDVTLRTSAAGMWFAPAVILLGGSSPLATTAALILVVCVTRVLYGQWLKGAPPPADGVDDPNAQERVLSGELPQGFLPRDFAPAFAAAAALQAGFVLSHLAQHSLSGACYALGAAVLTAYSISAGAWTRDAHPVLPRSILAVAVTLALTVILTIVGMQMYPGGGDSEGGGGYAATRVVHSAPPPLPSAPPERKYQPPPIDPARMGPAVSVPGGVPGVILWPETRPIPMLVAPLPRNGVGRGEHPKPFVIPFAGSYWMFRQGFLRPPANSLVDRGVPTTKSFKTVDSWPLEMEAHHRLDRPIDLACCSAIRLEILNADKFPKTVTVELALMYHAGPPFRLGRDPLRSTPDLYHEPIVPVPETLDYAVTGSDFTFDEFDVIFHRVGPATDRSVRVAIDRFVLIPR